MTLVDPNKDDMRKMLESCFELLEEKMLKEGADSSQTFEVGQFLHYGKTGHKIELRLSFVGRK